MVLIPVKVENQQFHLFNVTIEEIYGIIMMPND